MEEKEKFNLWVREFYDKNKALKSGKNYEYFRWFSSKKKRKTL